MFNAKTCYTQLLGAVVSTPSRETSTCLSVCFLSCLLLLSYTALTALFLLSLCFPPFLLPVSAVSSLFVCPCVSLSLVSTAPRDLEVSVQM